MSKPLSKSQAYEKAFNEAQGRYPAVPNPPVSKRNFKPRPKNQKEISRGQQEPYELSNLTNPNVVDNKNEKATNISFNRSNKISAKGDKTKSFSIGIQDIDEAVFYYFNNVIQPFVYQNDQRIQVPVIYASPERWKSYQKDGYYRDKGGKIMLPIIYISRNSIAKDRSVTAKVDSNSPHLYGSIKKGYNNTNGYSNFNVLNNRKPVIQSQAIVVPDFVTLQYSCNIQTYYMEQLNKIIESVEYASDSYWGDPERFKFRAFIDSITTSTELTIGQERLVKGSFDIRLRGHIIPETLQKDLKAVRSFNSKAKISITSEASSNLNNLNT